MISLEQLEIKKEFYKNKIKELMNFDIDSEINKRFINLKDKIQEEIVKEITDDVTKCKHYLEVIDELINSENQIEENQNSNSEENETQIKEEEV